MRAHEYERVNQAILALNSLFFGGEKPSPCCWVSSLDELALTQREVVQGIVQKIQRFGKPPPGATSQGALYALRAPASGYVCPEAGVGDVVSMSLEALSLPSGRVAGVDLAAQLKSPLREMVVDFEDHMLQDASEWREAAKLAKALTPYNLGSLAALTELELGPHGRMFTAGDRPIAMPYCDNVHVMSNTQEGVACQSFASSMTSYRFKRLPPEQWQPRERAAGQDDTGVFWTLRAQPYPRSLARRVAALAARAQWGYGKV